MNQSTPQEVDFLQFIDAELQTTKRRRTGNTIFMMHCHTQFKEYEYPQQKALFIQHNIYTNLNYREHNLHP
jgi:hypothetical protein